MLLYYVYGALDRVGLGDAARAGASRRASSTRAGIDDVSHTNIVAGRAWTQSTEIPEAYVMTLDIGGEPTGRGGVAGDVRRRCRPGDCVQVAFTRTRFSNQLVVTDVRRHGGEAMHLPAVKMTDMVIGMDFHTVLIRRAGADDAAPVLRRDLPVDDAGVPEGQHADQRHAGVRRRASMGYSVHIPQGAPIPPTMLNMAYWRRHLLNIPKALMLVALTLLANLAISGIASLFVKPGLRDRQVHQGRDRRRHLRAGAASWDTIKGSFAAYTKWSTWIKLLMPPIPYPGGQGSSAIGSPNVTVNGGAAWLRRAADGDVVQRPADRAERDAGGVQQRAGRREHRRHGAGDRW